MTAGAIGNGKESYGEVIHPHTELRFRNEQIGYGLVATRLIPRGTITWAGDALDQVLPPTAAGELPPLLAGKLETYAFRDAHGNRILCWDHARFVNHSCRANCLSADFDFELAIRDILPGEELTDDYGTLNIEASFPCCCGEPECRGEIHPEDVLRYAPVWDQLVKESLVFLPQVAQPLWPLVKQKQKIERVLAGKAHLPSLATHYCGPDLPANGGK